MPRKSSDMGHSAVMQEIADKPQSKADELVRMAADRDATLRESEGLKRRNDEKAKISTLAQKSTVSDGVGKRDLVKLARVVGSKIESEAERYARDKKELGDAKKQLDEDMKRLEVKIADGEKAKAELEKQLDGAKTEIANAAKEKGSMEKEWKALRAELDAAVASSKATEEARAILQRELGASKAEARAATEANSSLQSSLDAASCELKEKEAEITNLFSENKELSDKATGLERMLAKVFALLEQSDELLDMMH